MSDLTAGFVDVQSGAHYVRSFVPSSKRCGLADGGYCGDCLGRGPAAITFRGVHHSTISNCSLAHVGADGIQLVDGSQDNSISYTRIWDVSSSAIAVGTIDSCPWSGPAECFGDPSRHDSSNAITDCSTRDTGAEYRGSPCLLSVTAIQTFYEVYLMCVTAAMLRLGCNIRCLCKADGHFAQ